MAKRQQLEPPLIPPQGEVNAADAFVIGAFDEEDTQGIRVNPCFILPFLIKKNQVGKQFFSFKLKSSVLLCR